MDHLRELADVFLDRERRERTATVVAELGAALRSRLAAGAGEAAAWDSGVDAARRRLLVDLLWREPEAAVLLADRLDFLPGFVRSVAEDAWRAWRAAGPVRPERAPVELPPPDAEEVRERYLRRTGLLLLRDPALLETAARRLGSAVPFSVVLGRELREIDAARRARDGRTPPRAIQADPNPYRRAEQMGLVGLALSGGGIRSATFNLGVLQALAHLGLLRRIDLLSTVSGGGYVGGWLAAWIKRSPGGVAAVEAALAAEESAPVTFLRQYSNYLTPRPGFFSADTWTLVTTWVRNTLLNQTVLVLFLGAVLLAPHVVLGAQAWTLEAVEPGRLAPLLWLVPAALALIAISIRTGWQLRAFDRTLSRGEPHWSNQAQVQRRIVLVALLAAVLASTFLAFWLYRSGRGDRVERDLFWAFFALFALGLAITQAVGGFGRCFPAQSWWGSLGVRLLVWAIVPAAAALGAGIVVANVPLFTSGWFLRLTGGTWGVLIFGPMLLLQSYALAVTLQQGLLGRQFPDERREWWSRAGAWLLIYSFGWAILSTVVVLFPLWLLYWVPRVLPMGWDVGKKLLAAAWAAITGGGVVAARSHQTGRRGGAAGGGGGGGGRWTHWLALVAPYVFVAGLAVLLSLGVFLLLTRLAYPEVFASDVRLHAAISGQYWCLMKGAANCGPFERHLAGLPRPVLALLLLLGTGGLALLLAWRVDVNEFSMHHFYKNRLVRCYLGGSRGRGRRAPNPFTGFDPDDDIPLARMHLDTATPLEPVPEERYDGPYHIINTALNLVTGSNLAWQERKAASFVFTPHYAGYEVTRSPGARGTSADVASDGYRPTERYGYPPSSQSGFAEVGGIHLGTALAISGAAANPNMGYHSSSAAAFLMTVFNVRLGWWMGNPRHRVTYRYSSPLVLGLAYLLNELTGNSNDRSRYVNLSDGGHFENLGLYELVRRRCRWIIVSDAEQDDALTFGGLGNAIRKCRADFGVEIDLRPIGIRALDDDAGDGVHGAVGTIRYPDTGATGTVVYLKASLTGDEPTDVLEYRHRQPGFPHQTTGDQWFDESQFESYRALGYHVATQMLGREAAAPPALDLRASS